MQDDRHVALSTGACKSFKTKPLTKRGTASLSEGAANCRIVRSLERHCGRSEPRAHVSAIASDQVIRVPADYIKTLSKSQRTKMVQVEQLLRIPCCRAVE